MCNTCDELELKIEELEKEFEMLKTEMETCEITKPMMERLYLIAWQIVQIKRQVKKI